MTKFSIFHAHTPFFISNSPAKNYLILPLEIIKQKCFLVKKYLTSAVLLLSTRLLATAHAHDDRQQDVSLKPQELKILRLMEYR